MTPPGAGEPALPAGSGRPVLPRPAQLDALLTPRRVAVVGASERPGWGRTTVENLQAIGFDGDIVAVNPRYEAVGGHPCVPSLRHVPDVPDAVVFAIPAALVPDGIAEAVEVGVPAAVVYASGFGAAGEGEGGVPAEGSLLRRLQVLCDGQIAVLGPNCLGSINYARRTALYGISMPVAHAGADAGVALVAQSGNMALTLAMANRGVPFTHVVSCGNQLDVTAAELMSAFLRDPSVTVLAAIVEGVPDVAMFTGVLEEAAERDVPVIVLKIGESERGRSATVAHTGTMSGSGALYRGLFRRYGVIQVEDLDELLAAAALMAAPRRPAGAGVAVFASSGGECGLISDLAEPLGLHLPDLPGNVAASLAAMLPPYGRVANPLDITAGGWGDAALYSKVVSLLATVDGVSTIVAVADAPTLERPEAAEGFSGIIDGLVGGARLLAPRGAVVALLATVGDVARAVPPSLASGGVVPLVSLRAGLSALAKAGHRAAWQARRADDARVATLPTAGAATLKTAGEAVAALLAAEPSGATSEDLAKTVLAAYGIATPTRRLVADAPSAVEAAAEIGYPVVLKLAAPGLVHKTDVGGVALGLREPADVAAAAHRLLGLPDAVAGSRLLVERHVAGGIEVIVGGRRHETFGPVVMVGLGGVMAEAVSDVSHRPAPVSLAEALEMARELRFSRLLDGFRGSAGLDREPLASVVVAVSHLLARYGRVAEIDLNPVVADGAGGVVALDAVVVLTD